MMSRRGFTLIELLVVIAVLIIIAGIIFPVFSQAREKARRISCLSNTKQIGLAFHMYVQDWDEVMPMSDDFGLGPNGTRDERAWFWRNRTWPGSPIQGAFMYWGDKLAPYIKSHGDSVLPGGGTGNYGPLQRCPDQATWYTGYAYNIQLGYFPGDQLDPDNPRTGPIYEGVPLGSVNRPADLIALVDNSIAYSWIRQNLEWPHAWAYLYSYRYYPRLGIDDESPWSCLSMYDWPASADRTGRPYVGAPSGRHSGGVNIVFVDGHSKFIRTGKSFCDLDKIAYPGAP